MPGAGFDDDGVARLDEVVGHHVGEGGVPGATWLVARNGSIHVGSAGTLDAAGTIPASADTIYRISSTTKPLAAAAAMVLVDDGVLALDDPLDELVPELADRRVLVRPDGPLDETVPADRPLTLRDLLTFRMGWGFDFTSEAPHTALMAMAERGLGFGPPAPAHHLEPDAWLRVLQPLPLSFQPGERWLYHLSAEVLGVVVGRAAGSSFGAVLKDRVLAPLGMVDTAFWVAPEARDRFGPCWVAGQEPGEGLVVYDDVDGQWADPPPFEDGGAGLVSTVGDLTRFGSMLLGGGELDEVRVLSPQAVRMMTTDQLGADGRRSGPDPSGASGWGFGMAVQLLADPAGPRAGTYGWDGGLGSTWANDPEAGLTGVLLTNLAWSSPERPPIVEDFWAAAYAALTD